MVTKTYLKPTYLPTYLPDRSDSCESCDSSDSSETTYFYLKTILKNKLFLKTKPEILFFCKHKKISQKKIKMRQNLKTQNEKKHHKKLLMRQNSECDKTQELKIQNVTKHKN